MDDMKESVLQKKWVAMACTVLCTVLWGTAYPTIKYGYTAMALTATADKLMFAGVRFFLAGLMVFAFTWVKQKRVPRLPREKIGGVALYGVLQTGLMYIFNYIGVANTTATKTSVITAASAFFAVLLAPLFFRERLTVLKLIGIPIGVCGIMLVNTEGLGGFSLTGEGLVLLSAVLNTAGSFVGKRVSKGIVMESSAYQLMIGGGLILLTAFVMGGRMPLSPTAIWLTLYLAFVSAAAFTLWTALLVRYEAGQILVFNALIPITGAIWSFVILGERQLFEPLFLVSIILTAIGIILVNYQKKAPD